MDPPECSGHSHDHDHEDDLGLSLRPQIDLDRVMCLNEEVPNSGRAILKLHEDRLSAEPALRSPEDDPELLLTIPFTEAVTIKSIAIRSVGVSNDDDDVATAAPHVVKLFPGREDLDFETARELSPTTKLELVPPDHFIDGTIDYPCRPAGKYQNISALTIFFESNFASIEDEEASTEVTFVGLKGKGTNVKRKAVDCVYESRGMPTDHKVPEGEYGARDTI